MMMKMHAVKTCLQAEVLLVKFKESMLLPLVVQERGFLGRFIHTQGSVGDSRVLGMRDEVKDAVKGNGADWCCKTSGRLSNKVL